MGRMPMLRSDRQFRCLGKSEKLIRRSRVFDIALAIVAIPKPCEQAVEIVDCCGRIRKSPSLMMLNSLPG